MITLTGNPLSTNNIYKRHGHIIYMSKEGRQRKEQYQWEAKMQWRGNKRLTGALEIKVKVYFGDKRSRDWDNYHKLSMDSLSGIVWEDDSQVKSASVQVLYDKANPRIEIEIAEMRDNLPNSITH